MLLQVVGISGFNFGSWMLENGWKSMRYVFGAELAPLLAGHEESPMSGLFG